jgi:predicted RecB family nuclease
LRSVDGVTVFSPTDLVGFLDCDHAIRLDMAAFAKLVHRPVRPDEELQLLIDKGLEHERRYLDHLRAQGLGVTVIEQEDRSSAGLLGARDRTLEAMRRGDEVIYQATFVEDGWSGQADFLRRVDRPGRPSRLGPWVYEPEDTKLALSAKASALLQLLTYARMIAAVQGELPELVHVVLGRSEVTRATFRTADFAAFHRLILRRFEDVAVRGAPMTPDILQVVRDPVEHCTVCPWQEHCDGLRFRAGHLSRVAFIRRDEIEKLRAADVPTIWALGGLPVPPPPVPGLAGDVLARLEDQAAMQLEEERTGVRFHRILEHPEPPPERGLLMLPPPSPLDICFDFEGDRFAAEGGLEYLFGWVEAVPPGTEPATAPFHVLWAHDRAQERAALEQFIDYVAERRARDPGMHVYHYAPYEPAALHRLTGRHDTRQEELDVLLRAGVFVDLYRAVRQGVRVSSKSYSIKRLEKLYELVRDEEGIGHALSSVLAYERWLSTGDDAILGSIAAYNRDDCVSTLMLRDWLEERRAELVTRMGHDPGRPAASSGAPGEDQRVADAEVEAVRAALVADIDPSLPDDAPLDGEPGARRLLGNLLGWHRRESRTEWFEWFRMRELDADALVRETTPLGVDGYDGVIGREAKSDVHRWRFDPAQETRIRAGDPVAAVPPLGPDDIGEIGAVVRLDVDAGVVEIKVGASKERPDMDRLTGFVPGTPIRTAQQRASLLELGRWVAANGIDADGPYRAIRDVLLARAPRVLAPDGLPWAPLGRTGEAPTDAARRLALALDASYLAVQGPPGSGKTYTAAHVVLDLVREGRVVGITAFSHAAIGNLLREIVREADDGAALRLVQRADDADWCGLAAVDHGDNKVVEARVAAGTVDIVAGTTWLWSRKELTGAVDTLVVDEAGQVSLANLAAIGRAATNLVLLGDPQQLAQPVKGAHPAGAQRSALEHVVGEHEAIPADRGVFLATTRRLHPSICRFTSELFYEGRLAPMAGLEMQEITAPDGSRADALLAGAGLRWIPVHHISRSSSSPEEAEVVADCVRELLGRGWRDRHGEVRSLRPSDILVVSPYNAHVTCLRRVLPDDVRAGTVDKFQGQQAPVVIYSMATSTPDDMPRDMSFLFSPNRFNVATSRAQALVVLVCNPALLTVACRTPDQMRLANALAFFVELAGSPGA